MKGVFLVTEFEIKVLERLDRMDQRFDRIDQRFDRLEQRVARIEKTIVESLPNLVMMVNVLHTDYLVRNGLLAKEE